jgi:hypothetical protein
MRKESKFQKLKIEVYKIIHYHFVIHCVFNKFKVIKTLLNVLIITTVTTRYLTTFYYYRSQYVVLLRSVYLILLLTSYRQMHYTLYVLPINTSPQQEKM